MYSSKLKMGKNGVEWKGLIWSIAEIELAERERGAADKVTDNCNGDHRCVLLLTCPFAQCKFWSPPTLVKWPFYPYTLMGRSFSVSSRCFYSVFANRNPKFNFDNVIAYEKLMNFIILMYVYVIVQLATNLRRKMMDFYHVIYKQV